LEVCVVDGRPVVIACTEELVDPAGATLYRALHTDLPSAYVFPDPVERARVLPWLFAAYARYAHLFGAVDLVPGRPDGVSAWLPPTGAEETPERLAAAGLDRAEAVAGADALGRFAAMVGHIEARLHEAVPERHWYLFALGVDPLLQRQGLGRALMAAGLARAAADGVPAAWFTMDPSNPAFYARCGATVAAEGIEPNSGHRFWVFRWDPTDRTAEER
jgi:ribosomal protein S18 acetylase RimI-like enzyme